MAAQPAEGSPGDVIVLQGFNFPVNVADNQVLFNNADNEVKTPGTIISIMSAGVTDPTFGVQMTMEVVVPNGVRTGLVSLTSRTADDVIFAGALGFTAAPQIVTIAMTSDGKAGVVTTTGPLAAYTDDNVKFFGYNLETITGISVINDLTGEPIPCTAVSAFAPFPPDTYELPDGMTAVICTLPDMADLGGSLEGQGCPDGLTHPFKFTFDISMPSGDLLQLGPIEIQFRSLEFTEIVPASITSVLTPSGVRSGNFTIVYNLFEMPTTTRWDIIPEFLVPGTVDTWARCEPAGGTLEGRDMLPGGAPSGPNLECFLGPGQLNTFTWNTRHTGGGGLPTGINVTRLRLRAENPESGTSVMPCPGGGWTTGNIVIDNSAPLTGEVSESFGSQINVEEGNAVWNSAAGLLQGALVADTTFGTGLNDITLQAIPGVTYEFNTDSGNAVATGDNPFELFPGDENPGRLLVPPEFWMRTFSMDSGAQIKVVGKNPLVIRCSGTGNDSDLVAVVNGTIRLRGGDGSAPVLDPPETPFDPGDGGKGVAGGGDGGAGGYVFCDGTNNPGRVLEFFGTTLATTPATAGGNFGGGAGQNVELVRFPVEAQAFKPGAGGGGGHAEIGQAGTVNFSSATVQGKAGRGGIARGDALITRITAGSGGGGGGGLAFRSQGEGNNSGLIGKGGGGGGGGGGGFQLTAKGSIKIGATGKIQCDGGKGAIGENQGPPGPGGGGSGGAILLQASGSVSLETTCLLTAMGGDGGRTSSVGLVGGIGSPGWIRIESNGPLGFPGLVDFSGVQGGEASVYTGIASDPIDTGTGSDGPLDIAAPGAADPVKTIIVNTSTGEIFIPELAEPFITSATGNGEFHLSSLTIPEKVEVRVRGLNPLILRVSGTCSIAGTIDASGENGGQVNIFTDPPTAGVGGVQGPGGGMGGAGGSVTATDVTHGEAGGYPTLLPDENRADAPLYGGYDPPPSNDPFGPFIVYAPSGGESVDDGCTTLCTPGHGAGGAYSLDGSSGTNSGGTGDPGVGGKAFGTRFLQSPGDGTPLLVGGTGGSGGGGSIHQVTAKKVPGTGGGGAGGYVQLSVQGELNLAHTARILAEGGDAFQAPAGGANGGGGAGGAILIEGNGVMKLTKSGTAAPFISANGGTANLAPNADFDNSGGAPDYVGNGLTGGGNGGTGRIVIRSPIEFPVLGPNQTFPVGQKNYGAGAQPTHPPKEPTTGIHPAPSTGSFQRATMIESYVFTTSYSVQQQGGVRSSTAVLGPTVVDFASLSPADSVRVLLSGAAESRDVPGTVGDFPPGVSVPGVLTGSEFLRYEIYLYSNPVGPDIPSVDSLTNSVTF